MDNKDDNFDDLFRTVEDAEFGDIFEDSGDQFVAEEVLAFAEDYHSSDFARSHGNPCPPEFEIHSIVNSGTLPSPDLRAHLLSCSHCYRKFRSFRRADERLKSAGETSRILAPVARGRMFPATYFVAFGVLVLLFSGILLTYLSIMSSRQPEGAAATPGSSAEPVDDKTIARLSEPKTEAISNTPPTAVEPANSATKPIDQSRANVNKNSTLQVREEKSEQIENKATLDFSANSVRRNSVSTESVFIIRQSKGKLNLRLPANSKPGDYKVSVLDELGRPLMASSTAKSENQLLRVELDLDGFRGRARVCVAPNGEIPKCLPVLIGSGSGPGKSQEKKE